MKHDIEPIRDIQKGRVGQNIFVVPLGAEISKVTRTVSKLAATTNEVITFDFNTITHQITPKTAKEVLTPDNILTKIKSLQTRLDSAKNMIQKLEQQINEETTLGVILYGKDFLETIK